MTTLATTNETNGTLADAATTNTNFGNCKTVINGDLDATNLSAMSVSAEKFLPSQLKPGAEGQFLQIVSGIPTWAAGPTATPMPTGSIIGFGGTAPSGYLLCDGASYDTTAKAALFAVIGYTYGGSGANFNVPDLRGRMSVGKGTHVSVDALNDNDGIAEASRTPKRNHTHTISETGHNPGTFSSATFGPISSTTVTPPYLVCNFLIKE